MASGPQVLQTIQVQAEQGATGDTWSSFKPQGNLKPQNPEKTCNHLESTLSTPLKSKLGMAIEEESQRTQCGCNYSHRMGFESLLHQNIKEKDLQGVIDLILEESSGSNPLHQRRVDLVRVKKKGSHSDFLFALEEHMSLVEFNNMTKDSFLTHLFFE